MSVGLFLATCDPARQHNYSMSIPAPPSLQTTAAASTIAACAIAIEIWLSLLSQSRLLDDRRCSTISIARRSRCSTIAVKSIAVARRSPLLTVAVAWSR